jgi:hypothetical protein
MFKGGHTFLVFGIPIDGEYKELARIAWRDIKTWIEHGPKDLTPADRARTEVAQVVADGLRREGVSRPMAVAWELVGTPDPIKFYRKLKPGQPLGDLSQQAVLDAYTPLILSRLKYYGAAGNADAESAVKVELLTARLEYNPAVDASFGTFVALRIDAAIKYELYGAEGDAWSPDNADGDGEVTAPGKESDDAGESDGTLWGVIPTTYVPDQIADGIDRAHDDSNRLHHSRIPFWVQAWADQTHVRREFGAREEDWMDLPAAPQEMTDALAGIPRDAVVDRLAPRPSADEKEIKAANRTRDIVLARFYRKPPILLNAIARGELNARSKISYKEALNVAYRAAVRLAGSFEVKRPIRRPMRIPPPPRQLPTARWYTLSPLQELERWLKRYEIRLGSPPDDEEGGRFDRVRQTVHDSRYYPSWTEAYPDLDTAKWKSHTILGLAGWYEGGLLERSRRRIEGKIAIIEPDLVIVHRGFWTRKIFWAFPNPISL